MNSKDYLPSIKCAWVFLVSELVHLFVVVEVCKFSHLPTALNRHAPSSFIFLITKPFFSPRAFSNQCSCWKHRDTCISIQEELLKNRIFPAHWLFSDLGFHQSAEQNLPLKTVVFFHIYIIEERWKHNSYKYIKMIISVANITVTATCSRQF